MSPFSYRELWRRVSSSKVKESNPKCQLDLEIKGDIRQPKVQVVFSELSIKY